MPGGKSFGVKEKITCKVIQFCKEYPNSGSNFFKGSAYIGSQCKLMWKSATPSSAKAQKY